MLGWLAELFQPIIAAIMSLLVWLGLVSPHQEVSNVVAPSVVAENEPHVEAPHLEKPSEVPAPSEEVVAPSNE